MSDFNALLPAETGSEAAVRHGAVVAALELIKADVGGGGRSGSWLDEHLENVSKYADKIQAALTPSE